MNMLLGVFDFFVNMINAIFLAVANKSIAIGESIFDYSLKVEDRITNYLK